MHLTTKGRYAVKALADLAIHDDSGPVTLWSISERQGISLSYLEQLFARLRRQRIVVSSRGHGGGYSLARSADQISVAQIIEAVDGPLELVATDSPRNFQDVWSTLNQRVYQYLASVTLAQLTHFSERGNGAACSLTSMEKMPVILN